jgi:hypothetical protein
MIRAWRGGRLGSEPQRGAGPLATRFAGGADRRLVGPSSPAGPGEVIYVSQHRAFTSPGAATWQRNKVEAGRRRRAADTSSAHLSPPKRTASGHQAATTPRQIEAARRAVTSRDHRPSQPAARSARRLAGSSHDTVITDSASVTSWLRRSPRDRRAATRAPRSVDQDPSRGCVREPCPQRRSGQDQRLCTPLAPEALCVDVDVDRAHIRACVGVAAMWPRWLWPAGGLVSRWRVVLAKGSPRSAATPLVGQS